MASAARRGAEASRGYSAQMNPTWFFCPRNFKNLQFVSKRRDHLTARVSLRVSSDAVSVFPASPASISVTSHPLCVCVCVRGRRVPGPVLRVAAGLAQPVDVVRQRGDSGRSLPPEQLGALLHPHPRPAGSKHLHISFNLLITGKDL